MAAKTKSKLSEKQAAIDKGWDLYNRAMWLLEELQSHLEELGDEHDVDVPDETESAVYEAYSTLEEKYSTGCRILPAHSGDGGKA